MPLACSTFAYHTHMTICNDMIHRLFAWRSVCASQFQLEQMYTEHAM